MTSALRIMLIAVSVGIALAGCQGSDQPAANMTVSGPASDQPQGAIGGQNDSDSSKPTEQAPPVPDETFMMDLRETVNLSFKIMDAMDARNYEFLESIAAPGFTIDREHDRIRYSIDDQAIELFFLTDTHLGNLEYWGAGYAEDRSKFQVIFARYDEMTHGTIYFDFVREGDRWLLSGMMTNA